tara:strand:+ start:617 stop:2344 length:1728 start_codon:yes stop_codon:yes gene_type:complete
MPHQIKPGDKNSVLYGHTIGELTPSIIDTLGKKDNNQGTTIVDTKDADSFINQQNQIGVSGGVNQINPKVGSLASFLPDAQNLYNTLYTKSPEEQEREDRINTGMMMLNFFTKMGAEASKPGATALGAANIAGADTASMYIKQVNAERARRDAERKGVVGLASQLKTSADAKELAQLRLQNVKPSKPDQYKILNANEVVKALKLPFTNPKTGKSYTEGDVIDLTPSEFALVPRGNLTSFKEATPPKPNTYERLRDGIITNAKTFFNLGDGETLPSGLTSKLLSDITELRDTKLVPIPDPKDPTKTVMTLQQGVNMYDILEKEFGKEKVDKLKKLAGIETADTFITPEGTEEEGDGENKGKKFETINVGGTKFTVLSTKDTKLGTTEVKSLTNAKSGLKDLNTSLSLIFPNGKYNQKLVATMNIAPTWSLGLIGSLTGSDVANNARTTIQSMKRAIEIILRERSGAAVPPAELVNYLKLYLPNTFDNEVQARNKIDALLQYFKGSIDGINQGRNATGKNADPDFFNKKLPEKILDKTSKDGGTVMGRKIKIQNGITYIETEKGSNQFIPLVTKSTK